MSKKIRILAVVFSLGSIAINCYTVHLANKRIKCQSKWAALDKNESFRMNQCNLVENFDSCFEAAEKAFNKDLAEYKASCQ